MTKWQVIYEINGKQQKPIVFDNEKEAKQRVAMINGYGNFAKAQEVEDE